MERAEQSSAKQNAHSAAAAAAAARTKRRPRRAWRSPSPPAARPVQPPAPRRGPARRAPARRAPGRRPLQSPPPPCLRRALPAGQRQLLQQCSSNSSSLSPSSLSLSLCVCCAGLRAAPRPRVARWLTPGRPASLASGGGALRLGSGGCSLHGVHALLCCRCCRCSAALLLRGCHKLLLLRGGACGPALRGRALARREREESEGEGEERACFQVRTAGAAACARVGRRAWQRAASASLSRARAVERGRPF